MSFAADEVGEPKVNGAAVVREIESIHSCATQHMQREERSRE